MGVLSARGLMITVLATGLADAVRKDEAPEEGGFDLSAGMFGTHVSAWIRATADDFNALAARCAYYEKDAAAAWDKCEERRLQAEALATKLADTGQMYRDEFKRRLALVKDLDVAHTRLVQTTERMEALEASLRMISADALDALNSTSSETPSKAGCYVCGKDVGEPHRRENHDFVTQHP